MRKQDYVLDLIEQLKGTIPYILDMVKSGNYAEAHDLIDQVFRELIGVSSQGLIRLTDEDILRELQADAKVSWQDKAFYLATLLKEDADIYEEQEQENESVPRYNTAVLLLIHIALNDPERAQEYKNSITEMVTILEEFELSAHTYHMLMRYYELIGAYAKTEDILYEWLDAEPDSIETDAPNPAEMGIAFYERLLQKSDVELVKGNLPREEVESALTELIED